MNTIDLKEVKIAEPMFTFAPNSIRARNERTFFTRPLSLNAEERLKTAPDPIVIENIMLKGWGLSELKEFISLDLPRTIPTCLSEKIGKTIYDQCIFLREVLLAEQSHQKLKESSDLFGFLRSIGKQNEILEFDVDFLLPNKFSAEDLLNAISRFTSKSTKHRGKSIKFIVWEDNLRIFHNALRTIVEARRAVYDTWLAQGFLRTDARLVRFIIEIEKLTKEEKAEQQKMASSRATFLEIEGFNRLAESTKYAI